jgi:hypothetical protein
MATGDGLATDLATVKQIRWELENALALLHRGSPTPANGPALAMTPATASASHGPSVSDDAGAGAAGLDPATDLPMATGDGLAKATSDGPAGRHAGDGPGLARWHHPDRRRNDTGDRERQPRGVYERWGGPIRMFSAADDCSLGHMFDSGNKCSPGRACGRTRGRACGRAILSLERPGIVVVVRNGGER